MEARGRRRDRAGLGGEHGLVVGPVLFSGRAARGDIGRQRRVPDALDRLVERRAGKGEAQQSLARFALFFHVRVERRERGRPSFRCVSPNRMRSPTFSRFAGRTSARQRQSSTRLISVASIEATASSLHPHALETGRDHACVVDDERVARTQEVRQVQNAGVDEGVVRVRQPASGRCRAAKRAEAQSARAEARNRRRRRASVNLAAAAGGDRRRREKVFRAPRAALSLQLSVALMILSGSRTGSPRLILSTFSMPDDDLSPHRILTVEEAGVVEADEELRIGRIRALGARHRHGAAHMRLGVELGLEVRVLRSARAGAVRAAGLGHEAFDHAVKDDAVVEPLDDELLDVGDVAGATVRVHLDDDRALGRLQRQRVACRS